MIVLNVDRHFRRPRQICHSLIQLNAAPKIRITFIQGPFLCAFDHYFRHVCLSLYPSVGPRGTIRFPPNGFSWNVIFQYFSKKLRYNSWVFKVGQEYRVLYTKTNNHFWSYLAHFFLEWEMFKTKFVEKVKTHILCSVTFFFQNSWLFSDRLHPFTGHEGP